MNLRGFLLKKSLPIRAGPARFKYDENGVNSYVGCYLGAVGYYFNMHVGCLVMHEKSLSV